MKSILKITIMPLLSLFLFVLGSGLFTTLLAVRLHYAGASSIIIGAMTGAYYAGLAYGSFQIEGYILRVGHIRAFAAFASFLTAISLMQGLILSHWVWLILRFLGGFATAGIFVVIESWLLSVGSIKNRGQILALYMISLYAGQAIGQFMIKIADPMTLTLFALTAISSSIAVIPLALTTTPSPEISEPSSLGIKKLFEASGSGMIGSFSSGLILGAIYGLFPLFVLQKTGSTTQVALFMALVILGGMSLQYPVGRISDFIERRLVLAFLSIFAGVISLGMIYGFHIHLLALLVTFIFGGLTFTLYPVSVSHACDTLDQKDIVSATQGILLAYSIGATVGPFIAPLFMHHFGPSGLLVYIVSITSTLTIFLLWRKTSVASTPQEEQFVPMPQTTPVTAELDPRSEN